MRVVALFALAACGSSSSPTSAPSQNALRDKILAVNAHVVVTKNSTFVEYRDVLAKIQTARGVIAAEPIAFGEVLIAAGGEWRPILVKGVDATRVNRVLDLERYLAAGKLADLAGDDGIFIGRSLARELRVKIGDTVDLILPLQGLGSDAGSAQAPAKRRFHVRGIFFFDFDEYDRRLAVTNLTAAQRALERGDVADAVELKVTDIEHAADVARAIEEQLGGAPYRALDWRAFNPHLFGD